MFEEYKAFRFSNWNTKYMQPLLLSKPPKQLNADLVKTFLELPDLASAEHPKLKFLEFLTQL